MITLHGLLFFVVAMATIPVCLIGALIQILWVRARAPLGRAGSRTAAGLVGPLTAALIGGAAMWICEDHVIDGETLDDLWFVLPAFQIAVWVVITMALSNIARAADDPV